MYRERKGNRYDDTDDGDRRREFRYRPLLQPMVRRKRPVKTLQHQGYDMTKLSIVGKDYHTEEHVVGYYNTGDLMKSWG